MLPGFVLSEFLLLKDCVRTALFLRSSFPFLKCLILLWLGTSGALGSYQGNLGSPWMGLMAFLSMRLNMPLSLRQLSEE